MNRVTGYKCIFESKAEIWRFALTLKGGPGEAGFAVSNPETAETLLDMIEDASGCQFDPESGELAFSFDYTAPDDDESEEQEQAEADEDEAGETAEADDEAGEAASSKAA